MVQWYIKVATVLNTAAYECQAHGSYGAYECLVHAPGTGGSKVTSCSSTGCISLQACAAVLPSDVFAPGTGVATVTADVAAAADLPAGCLVCAGTTGEGLLALRVLQAAIAC